MLRAVLITAAALGCFGLVALAQPGSPPGTKKGDDVKATKKATEKSGANGKEAPKPPIPLEKMKLPKDAILVLVDDLVKAAALNPKMYLLLPEQYKALLDKIDALNQQLKPERRPPSSCKLAGKLEGEFVVFRAEYRFFTDAEQPKAVVSLGLKGGFLSDEGDLDGEAANLEPTDDGFLVRVAKAGSHLLTLNFRVPVPVKKTAGATLERGFDLSLPGAAATRLDLDLPINVKELMWKSPREAPSSNLEKTKKPGRWSLSLGTAASVIVAWKEPAPLSGAAPPLPSAEGQIQVNVDAKDVQIEADLFLQDRRAQTTKWVLHLPAQVQIEKIKVKAPGGLLYTLAGPEKDQNYYTLETSAATAERWQVTVPVNLPRPDPETRLAVGPFHVRGAFQQTGTITVKMPTAVSLGQRLIPTRHGQTYQTKNTDTEAVFHYTLSEKDAKGTQAPLELAWRTEKNQLETRVTHEFKLATGPDGWEVDATTRIHVSAVFATIHAVDLMLPPPRPRGLGVIATARPTLGFPADLPWGCIWDAYGTPWVNANTDEYTIADEKGNLIKPVPIGAAGRMRVPFDSDKLKKTTLIVVKKIRLPGHARRLRLDLPRPVGTQDRGAKMMIQSDEGIELRYGPAGAEEPIPDPHHFDRGWIQAPANVELAWQPYHRQIITASLLDVQLHEHTAQVTQTLRIPKDLYVAANGDAKSAMIALRIPPGVEQVKMDAGGEIVHRDAARRILRVQPKSAGEATVVLKYDLVRTGENRLEVTPLWPEGTSLRDVKVRVWAKAGVKARVADELRRRGLWKERSIEVVAGREEFPALVLEAFGPDLPLALQVDDAAGAALASFVADRALIQTRLLDDGSQQCRALYFVRAMHADHVDVELPLALPRLREMPVCKIGAAVLAFERLGVAEKTIRVKLHPDLLKLPAVLEIRFTLPADALEQNTPWRTTLFAPIFRSEVVIWETRWQFMAQTPMLAASLQREARAHVRWTFQNGLLMPEPAFSSEALESWLVTGNEGAESGSAGVFSFSLKSSEPETVYHFPWPRNWWLLGCSGIFLIVTLGAYLSPLPRVALGFLLLALALGVLAFGVFCPVGMPPLLYGLEPGVVLFVAFAAGHWVVREYLRRQDANSSVFLRAKPGSTLMRGGAGKRPREASTVDSPPDVPEGSLPPADTPQAAP